MGVDPDGGAVASGVIESGTVGVDGGTDGVGSSVATGGTGVGPGVGRTAIARLPIKATAMMK